MWTCGSMRVLLTYSYYMHIKIYHCHKSHPLFLEVQSFVFSVMAFLSQMSLYLPTVLAENSFCMACFFAKNFVGTLE